MVSSLAPKLVVLAAVLSAVALAAPVGTAYEAEATELVQTTAQATASRIQSLKDDFAQLKSKIMATKTKDSRFDSAIEKLLKLVSDEIQPAINEAHAADQMMVEEDHQTIVDLNTNYVNERDGLLATATGIRTKQTNFNTDVAEWKAAAHDYEVASQVYLSVYADRNKICCDKDKAGVLDVVYTPAYYACDFSNDATAENCVSDADSSISSFTVDRFAAGKEKYDGLFTHCNTLKASFIDATNDLDAKDTACDGKRNDAKDLESEITAERKTFDPLWSDSVSGYTAAYKRDTDKYAQTTKDVQGTREPDRKAEWKSVDEIECMLKTFKVHRSFTEEQLKECNERKVHVGHLKITYPATPAKEHQTLPAWVAMDSYSAFERTCEEENVPQLEPHTCNPGEAKAYPSCTNHK